MRARDRQRGAAIVTALLVVTLASIVVSGLFWREHVAVRSVENRLALAQSRWIERAALVPLPKEEGDLRGIDGQVGVLLDREGLELRDVADDVDAIPP